MEHHEAFRVHNEGFVEQLINVILHSSYFLLPKMSPLAERMRPVTLDDYIGQEHLVGEGAILRKSVETGVLPSLIFWGPPGVGKTHLAVGDYPALAVLGQQF